MATLPSDIVDGIDQRLTDRVLSNEGYPIARKWTNSKVKTIFGLCSKQHHMLQILVQNHDWGVRWLDRWRQSETDAQGCLAFKNSKGGRYGTKLYGDCRNCDKALESTIVSSRLVAIFQRPFREMWKGVLTRKRYPRKYVFEGSGRCNQFGHPNHCMTPSHLVLETFMHNTKRKSHHSGAHHCNCVHACIGESVRPQSNYLRFPKPEPQEEAGTVVQPQIKTAIESSKQTKSSVSRPGLSQQSWAAVWKSRVTKPPSRPEVRKLKKDRAPIPIQTLQRLSAVFDPYMLMD